MSKTTSNGNPYPEDSDAPDGPTQIKALAEALNLIPTKLIADAAITPAKMMTQGLDSAKEEMFAPTGLIHRLNGSGTVTKIKAPSLEVQLVIYWSGGGSVTFKDGVSNLQLASDFTLGEFDILTLLWVGAYNKWLEVARSSN